MHSLFKKCSKIIIFALFEKCFHFLSYIEFNTHYLTITSDQPILCLKSCEKTFNSVLVTNDELYFSRIYLEFCIISSEQRVRVECESLVFVDCLGMKIQNLFLNLSFWKKRKETFSSQMYFQRDWTSFLFPKSSFMSRLSFWSLSSRLFW